MVRKNYHARLPDGKKSLRICLLDQIHYTNVTDGKTPHDGAGRAMTASRDENPTKISDYLMTIYFSGNDRYKTATMYT